MPRYTQHTRVRRCAHYTHMHMCTHVAFTRVYTLHTYSCVHTCPCTHVHVHMCMCSHVHAITRVRARLFTYILFSTHSHAHPHPPCRMSWLWPSGPAATIPHGRFPLPPHHAGQGRPTPCLLPLGHLPQAPSMQASQSQPQLQQIPQAMPLLKPSQHSQDPPQLAGQHLLLAAQEQSGCLCLCQKVLAMFGVPAPPPPPTPRALLGSESELHHHSLPAQGPGFSLPSFLCRCHSLSVSGPAVCPKAGHLTSLSLSSHTLGQGRWTLRQSCTQLGPIIACWHTGCSGLPAGDLCSACGREVTAPL